jgi:Delta7-sterol 5-desaturase
MDLVLRICDDILLDKVWAVLIPSPHLHASASNASTVFHPSTSLLSVKRFPTSSAWPRDYVLRQLLSLCALTLVRIHSLYFIFAGLSYKFIFNHDMMRHPRFLKNQIKLEIQ